MPSATPSGRPDPAADDQGGARQRQDQSRRRHQTDPLAQEHRSEDRDERRKEIEQQRDQARIGVLERKEVAVGLTDVPDPAHRSDRQPVTPARKRDAACAHERRRGSARQQEPYQDQRRRVVPPPAPNGRNRHRAERGRGHRDQQRPHHAFGHD